MMVEQEEAESVAQLQFVEAKQEAAAQAAMESLLERRQMMVEQEEADSVAQLQFVEEKQMVADVFARQPDGKIAVDAEAALMAGFAERIDRGVRQRLLNARKNG